MNDVDLDNLSDEDRQAIRSGILAGIADEEADRFKEFKKSKVLPHCQDQNLTILR